MTLNATSPSSEGLSYTTIAFISLTGIVTFLAIVAASIYFAGYGDDVAEWWAKRYYKAKALAEVKVFENAGSEKVQGMVKGTLHVAFSSGVVLEYFIVLLA